MIIIFQIFFVLFVLLAISGVVKKKREGLLGTKGTFFWIIFWLTTTVAVLWPNSTVVVANTFGIGRGTDFVLYIAIAVLFYLVFKLHVKLEVVGKDITKVVRKNALDKEV